jgi:hypothetical protein
MSLSLNWYLTGTVQKGLSVFLTFVLLGTRSVKLHIRNHTGEIVQGDNGVATGVNTILILIFLPTVYAEKPDRLNTQIKNDARQRVFTVGQ